MARPKKEINEALLKKLCQIHCTMTEIASILDCSVDTLERRFADTIKKSRDHGKMSLRRKQFEKALSGNTTMLVWLGKQFLSQVDKIDHKEAASEMTDEELLCKTNEAKVLLEERIAKNKKIGK